VIATSRVAADAWDPEQYGRFHAERTRPFLDLLALVRPRPGLRIVDLGCGTGELTRRLHRELQAAETLGVDRSSAMLARSAEFADAGLRFVVGDAGTFIERDAWDLVFSNAALHWVPDHPALFRRLADALRADGQLAVQMPANHDHPSHVVAAEVAAEPPFRDALGADLPSTRPVLAPEEYAALLARLGFRAQHVRLQVYGHWLGEPADVVEWVKGTLFTTHRERLPPRLYDELVARYRARLLPRLDDARPYFFAFKRVLLWAAR
jgi:trans-aconitate 2-methyltransferase